MTGRVFDPCSIAGFNSTSSPLQRMKLPMVLVLSLQPLRRGPDNQRRCIILEGQHELGGKRAMEALETRTSGFCRAQLPTTSACFPVRASMLHEFIRGRRPLKYQLPAILLFAWLSRGGSLKFPQQNMNLSPKCPKPKNPKPLQLKPCNGAFLNTAASKYSGRCFKRHWTIRSFKGSHPVALEFLLGS